MVKTFSQDEDRLKTNANYGNYNKNGHLRKKGMWSQGNSLYLTAYQKSTKKCVKLPLNYRSQDYTLDSDNDKIVFLF